MKVGIPREVKNNEYRVAITPSGVHELVRHGHEVFVERTPASAPPSSTRTTSPPGATILDTADDVWGTGDLILKVKEPIAGSTTGCARARPSSPTCTSPPTGRSPTSSSSARSPASPTRPCELPGPLAAAARPDVRGRGPAGPAGRRADLMRAQGGRGVLMGGVRGVYAAKVVVIGAGVSGMNAAAIALGMQAEVLLLDRDIDKLRQPTRIYQGHCQTVASNAYEVERASSTPTSSSARCWCPGAKAPKLVTNELVSRMKPGSVLVDISIDQGGCFEDSRPTTHADPTYQVHNSVFYCVANMPGAVPHTRTYALTNVTLPYAVRAGQPGLARGAARRPAARARASTPTTARVTYAPVAEAHGFDSVDLETMLAG